MPNSVRKILDAIVITTLVAAFVACVWKIVGDVKEIRKASKETFEEWKPRTGGDDDEPEEEGAPSFEDLKRINPEVIGWIEIYGTGIDFPIAQAEDDEKYVNLDAFGVPSPAGCPFLDSRCDPDFEDAHSIVYGHSMEAGAMFGDVKKFVKQEFLERHLHGVLTTRDGSRRSFRAIACLETSAYDEYLYFPISKGDDGAVANLMKRIEEKKLTWVKDSGVGSTIALSTCENPSTLGRIVLVGRLGEVGDPIAPNPYSKKDRSTENATEEAAESPEETESATEVANDGVAKKTALGIFDVRRSAFEVGIEGRGQSATAGWKAKR